MLRRGKRAKEFLGALGSLTSNVQDMHAIDCSIPIARSTDEIRSNTKGTVHYRAFTVDLRSERNARSATLQRAQLHQYKSQLQIYVWADPN